MKTISKKYLRTACVVLLLPVGIVSFLAMGRTDYLSKVDPGFGRFETIATGSISDSAKGMRAEFEGWTPARWSSTPPSDVRYDRLQLTWENSKMKGEGTLDLGTMKLTSTTETRTVDEEWFRELLGNRALAAECIEAIAGLHTGGLLPPGSEPRSYNRDTLRRSMSHELRGFKIPYSAVAWAGFWIPVVVVAFLALRKRDAPTGGEAFA